MRGAAHAAGGLRWTLDPAAIRTACTIEVMGVPRGFAGAGGIGLDLAGYVDPVGRLSESFADGGRPGVGDGRGVRRIG